VRIVTSGIRAVSSCRYIDRAVPNVQHDTDSQGGDHRPVRYLLKRLSHKMFGDVPEPVEVMWHNRPVLNTVMGFGRKKVQKWNRLSSANNDAGRATRSGSSWFEAVLVMKTAENRLGDDPVAVANPMAGRHRRKIRRIRNAGAKTRVRTPAVIQLDNATPTILSLAKFATRGIRGSVGWSRCTKR
jgi:hypothetical protein